jgi:Circadian oscillating protein COP23
VVAKIIRLLQHIGYCSVGCIFLSPVNISEAVPVPSRQGIFVSCSVINNIPTTVFANSDAYIEKVSLIEWMRAEDGEKNCHKVSLKLELAFRDKSIKYIVPGYTSTGDVALCKSINKKSVLTENNLCQRKDILISLTTKLTANQYLEDFYRIAFSAYRQNPMQQSLSALKRDNNDEPYIDIVEAIHQSSAYKNAR